MRFPEIPGVLYGCLCTQVFCKILYWDPHQLRSNRAATVSYCITPLWFLCGPCKKHYLMNVLGGVLIFALLCPWVQTDCKMCSGCISNGVSVRSEGRVSFFKLSEIDLGWDKDWLSRGSWETPVEYIYKGFQGTVKNKTKSTWSNILERVLGKAGSWAECRGSSQRRIMKHAFVLCWDFLLCRFSIPSGTCCAGICCCFLLIKTSGTTL